MRHTIEQVIRRASRLLPSVRTGVALVLLLLVALFSPRGTRSQTAAPTTSPQAPTQRVVYWQVFKQVVLLDNQADLADQSGQGGAPWRNFYQNKAAMTATEAALLKSTAHSTVNAVHAIDQQINAAVVAYRALVRLSTSRSTMPPLPPELATLQTQKDNLILSSLAAVQSGFGSSRFQNLDKFVQSYIAPHITVATAAVPTPPTKPSSPPPMQPVPWH